MATVDTEKLSEVAQRIREMREIFYPAAMTLSAGQAFIVRL